MCCLLTQDLLKLTCLLIILPWKLGVFPRVINSQHIQYILWIHDSGHVDTLSLKIILGLYKFNNRLKECLINSLLRVVLYYIVNTKQTITFWEPIFLWSKCIFAQKYLADKIFVLVRMNSHINSKLVHFCVTE